MAKNELLDGRRYRKLSVPELEQVVQIAKTWLARRKAQRVKQLEAELKAWKAGK